MCTEMRADLRFTRRNYVYERKRALVVKTSEKEHDRTHTFGGEKKRI